MFPRGLRIRYKEGKYEDAVEAYTKAIEADATQVVWSPASLRPLSFYTLVSLMRPVSKEAAGLCFNSRTREMHFPSQDPEIRMLFDRWLSTAIALQRLWASCLPCIIASLLLAILRKLRTPALDPSIEMCVSVSTQG